MPMTVVITNNVPAKYRGFLASCMLELAPGVYSHPKMSAGIRDRLWKVLEKWYYERHIDCSVMLIWQDTSQPGGQGIKTLGLPQRTVLDYDGVLLSKLSPKESAANAVQTAETQQ
ncbi:MAG: type I-E CRISPR-associated endoribonuclease Cas2e [Pyramidobacter sp.]|nr:type I-E CRISPR-associated endoribonuclease Cas2e [Pyramidobacter sp.]